MDQLREGIQLRAYGQKNPLIEYKKEGFSIFIEMMHDTNKETIKKVYRTNLIKAEDSSISTSANMPSNLKTKQNTSPDLGFINPPSNAQSSPQGNQGIRSLPHPPATIYCVSPAPAAQHPPQ